MSCLHKRAVRAGAVAAAVLLGGCASLSGDGGFGAAAGMSEQRTGMRASVAGHLPRNDDDARALAIVIAKKLEQPLGADDAVQVALLNNRGLQASYWSLGIAEADLVQAGRLQNPVLDFKRSHGGDVTIERTLTLNLLGILTSSTASRIEGRRFEQAKLLVSNQALKVAADTRRAWVEAVAAVQTAQYVQQVEASAQASAELAERMRKAGNWSAMDLAREQAYHAQTVADVSRAQKVVLATHEKLARLMGVSGAQAAYSLPERLPDLPDVLPGVLPDGLPDTSRELADIEQIAINQRLDIQAAKLDTEQTAASLGLSKTTRFINVLDLGAVHDTEAGHSARGYELTLEIPLFDWGSARVARAEATYMQSVNLLAQAAAEARSEARESYADYRASYDLARHYRDQVLPLRKQISDQTLLRYNGMLVSVFELLADAREQATAVSGYIGALKDYWTAQANLEAALGGQLPTNQGVAP